MLENANKSSSLRRIAWIGGGFLTLMLLVGAVARKKELTVGATVVEVEPLEDGALLIDSMDVIRLVERSIGSSLDEQNASFVDEDQVERALEENLFVKNAEVLLTANSNIKINIEQRVPILRVVDKLGVQYYLDKEGAKVPLSRHFTARTLVATGNIPPHTPEFLTKKNNGMKDLFELTNFILGDPLWKAMFEQVHINGKDEFVLVPMVGDQAIILGKWDTDVEAKFKKLRTFYDEGLSREGWQKYKTIDLRFRNQVVCERK